MYMERNKKRFDLAISGFIFAFACFMMVVSFHTKVIPVTDGLASMDFPRIIFALMILFAAVQVIFAIIWFRKHPLKQSTEEATPLMEKKAVLTAVLICIYAALWNVIGFSLSTLLYFFAQTKLLDKRKSTLRVALISLLAVLLIDLVFVLVFKVDFPEPLFELIRGY